MLTLHIQHTSASILINENYDSDVLVDLENFFSRLVLDGDHHFTHTTEGLDDMPAHIRTALTQTNLSLPVQNKKILLGIAGAVALAEYGRYQKLVDSLSVKPKNFKFKKLGDDLEVVFDLMVTNNSSKSVIVESVKGTLYADQFLVGSYRVLQQTQIDSNKVSTLPISAVINSKEILNNNKDFKAPLETEFKLPGKVVKEEMNKILENLYNDKIILDHGLKVAQELAHVLSGGDTSIDKTLSEDDLYKLELDAFMRLIETKETQDRIKHTLATGKPLVN